MLAKHCAGADWPHLVCAENREMAESVRDRPFAIALLICVYLGPSVVQASLRAIGRPS